MTISNLNPLAGKARRKAWLETGSVIAVATAMLSLATGEARAQAVQGTVTVSQGTVNAAGTTDGVRAVSATGTGGTRDTIRPTSDGLILNWTPTDTATSTANIDFLPTNNVLTFDSATNFTVLNRVIPADTTRAIEFNGLVESFVGAAQGGNVWFYSPGGIVVGAGGAFNVGSLLLSTTDIDSASVGITNQPIRFNGNVGGGTISIEGGASISASDYVVAWAPRVEQGGTVTAGGNVAYVGGESGSLFFSGNLFSVSVLVGTDDPNGVVHTGTTTGATGLANETRQIQMVAIPKNTFVSMLVGGNVGYQEATSAAIVNGEIVLSTGGTGSGVTLTGGNVTSDLTIDASGAVELAANAANGNLSIGSAAYGVDLSISSGEAVALSASDGADLSIFGDASLSAGNFGSGGTVSVDVAAGSSLAITGGLTLGAAATNVQGQPSQGGSVTLTNAGTLSVSSIDIDASAVGGDGFAGIGGGSATGGTVSVTTNSPIVGLTSLSIDTSAIGGAGGDGATPGAAGNAGGSATGGSATVELAGSNALSTLAASASIVSGATGGAGGAGGLGDAVTAGGAGGTGGSAQGGSARFVLSGAGTSFTYDDTFFSVDAAATGGAGGAGGDNLLGGTGGNGGVGGDATGGTAVFEAGSGTELTLQGASGSQFAFSVGGTGGAGGFGGSLDLINGGIQGAGGNGGSGTGGSPILRAVGGNIIVNDLALTATGTGGAGGLGGDDGNATFGPTGNGGNGIGGTPTLEALEGSPGRLTLGTVSIDASGIGGGGTITGTTDGGTITLTDASTDPAGLITMTSLDVTAAGSTTATPSFVVNADSGPITVTGSVTANVAGSIDFNFDGTGQIVAGTDINLVAGGDITLDHVNNAGGTISLDVGRDMLATAATGDFAANAASIINAAREVTITAQNISYGTIAAGNDNIFDAGEFALTLNAINGSINGGAISAISGADLDATQAIATGTIAVTDGPITIDAGTSLTTGDISIAQGGFVSNEAITINAGGNMVLGDVAAIDALNITSGGSLTATSLRGTGVNATATGAVDIGTATIFDGVAGGGGITISGTSIMLDSADASTLVGNDIQLDASAGGLTLGTINTEAFLTANATGDITFDTLTGTGVYLTTTGGNVSGNFASSDRNINTGQPRDVIIVAPGDVSVTSFATINDVEVTAASFTTDSIVTGNGAAGVASDVIINVTGNATINSADVQGFIDVDAGSIVIGDVAVEAATLLDSTTGDIAIGSVITDSQVTANSAGNLTLGSSEKRGTATIFNESMTFTAAGDLTVTGVIDAHDNITLTAGGAVDTQQLIAFRNVTVAAGTSADVAGITTTVLGTGNTASVTGQSVTVGASTLVGGFVANATAGDVTLTGDISGFSLFDIDATGNVSFTTLTNGRQVLIDTAGDITGTSILSVGADVLAAQGRTLNAGGNLTLTGSVESVDSIALSAGGTATVGDLVTTNSGNATIDAQTVQLATATLAGSLTITTTGGGISVTGLVDTTGAVNFNSATDISFADIENDNGNLTLSAAGDVTGNDALALAVAGDGGLDRVIIDAGGNITLTGTAQSVEDGVFLTAGGAIDASVLDAADNIQVTAGGAVSIGSSNQARGGFTTNLSGTSVTLGGAVSQSAIVLTSTAGNIDVTGAVDAENGVTFTSAGDLNFTTIDNANANLSLSAAGDVTGIDAINSAPVGSGGLDRTIIDAGGSIALSGTAQSLDDGVFLTAVGDIAVGVIDSADTISVVGGGALDIGSVVNANNFDTTLEGTSVALGGADVVSNLTVTSTGGDIVIALDGTEQVLVGGATLLNAAGNILISHSNNAVGGLSIDSTGNLTALATGNFDSGPGSIVSSDGTVTIQVQGDASANDLRGVGAVELSALGQALLNNATVTGPPTVINLGAGQLVAGPQLLLQSGFDALASDFVPTSDATITGTVTSTGNIAVNAGGSAVFATGSSTISDNGIIVQTGDDIVIETGALVESSVNPATTTSTEFPFTDFNNLLLAAGNLTLTAGSPTPVASLVNRGTLNSNGFAIVANAEAVDGTGGTFQGTAIAVNIANAPAAGVAQSDDAGLLGANCLEGSVCLGNVIVDNIFSVGQSSPNGVISLDIDQASVSANDIILLIRDDIVIGTDGLSTTFDAADLLSLTSTAGNIDLRGAVVSSAVIELRAAQSLLGTGVINSANDVAIEVGQDLFAAAITTGGELTTVDGVGNALEEFFNVAGTMSVGALTVGAGAVNYTAGGDLLLGSVTTPGTDVTLTAGGLASIGSTTTATNLTLNGNSVSIGTVDIAGAISATATTDIDALFMIAGGTITLDAGADIIADHAEAGGDFLATGGGSFFTGLNSIITVGDIIINVAGPVDLGNSSAGGLIDVTGTSIDFASLISGGTIDLFATAGAIGANTGGTVDAGGDVTVSGDDVTIASIITPGAISATSTTGGVTLSALDAGTTIDISSGGATSLSNYAAGGNVSIAAGSATLGAGSVGGGLQVDTFAGDLLIALDGAEQITVGGSAGFDIIGNMIVTHTNNALGTISLDVVDIIGATVTGNIDSQPGAFLSGDQIIFSAGGDISIDDMRAVQLIDIDAGGNALVRDAVATGPQNTANAAGIFIDAGFGFDATGNPIYDPNFDATITGNVTSYRNIEINAGGSAIFVAGSTTAADNALLVATGDDIIVQAGALLSSANNPTDAINPLAPFVSGPNIDLFAGGIANLSAPILTPISSVVIAGTLDANAAAVSVFGNAVDGTGSSISGGWLAVDIADAPANGLVQSDDAGLLAAPCLEGNVCLGDMAVTNRIEIGQASNNDVIALAVAQGTIASAEILITTRSDIAIGTGGVASTVDAPTLLSVTSTEGDILLADATLTSNQLLLDAAGSLLGTGTLTSANDIGLTFGQDVVAASIVTGGQITDVASVGGVLEAVYAAPGSFLVDSVTIGAGDLAIDAGGAIAILDATVPGSDILLTAVGAATLGTTGTANNIAVTGASVTFNDLAAAGTIRLEALAGDILGAAPGTLSGGGLVELIALTGAVTAGDIASTGGLFVRSGTTTTLGDAILTGGGADILAGGDTLLGTVAGADASGIAVTAGGSLTFVDLQTLGDVSLFAAAALLGNTIDAGGAVSVDGSGTTLGSVAGGGDIFATANAGTLQLADATSTGGEIVLDGATITALALDAATQIGVTAGAGGLTGTTLDAGGDISITSGAGIDFLAANTTASIVLDAAGDIAATTIDGGTGVQAVAGGAFTATNVFSDPAAGVVDIDAVDAILIDELEAFAGSLVSTGGVVAVSGDARIGDLLIAEGTGIDVVSSIDLALSALATAGDIDASATGSLELRGGSATGDILLASGQDLTISQDTRADGSLTLDAGGILAIDALASGQAVSVGAADIAIGAGGALGESDLTQSIDITANGDARIGGTGGAGGFEIDNDEFSRIFSGGDITINVGAGTGNALLVGDLDIVVATGAGGATDGNIGTAGRLQLNSSGDIFIDGAVLMSGTTVDNVLGFDAFNLVWLVTDSGSIQLLDANEALAGTIEVSAADFYAMTDSAFADIAGLTLEDIDARLADSDGLDIPEGVIRADTLTIDTTASDVFIQNTVPGLDFDERRGFEVNTLNLSDSGGTAQPIVINGTIGGLTGIDAIAAAGITSNFDLLSTINGCLIANPAICVVIPTGGTPPFDDPTRDLIEEELDPDGSEDGVGSFGTMLIELKPLDEADEDPLIDEPVTGAGNEDLWVDPNACPEGSETELCEPEPAE